MPSFSPGFQFGGTTELVLQATRRSRFGMISLPNSALLTQAQTDIFGSRADQLQASVIVWACALPFATSFARLAAARTPVVTSEETVREDPALAAPASSSLDAVVDMPSAMDKDVSNSLVRLLATFVDIEYCCSTVMEPLPPSPKKYFHSKGLAATEMPFGLPGVTAFEGILLVVFQVYFLPELFLTSPRQVPTLLSFL